MKNFFEKALLGKIIFNPLFSLFRVPSFSRDRHLLTEMVSPRRLLPPSSADSRSLIVNCAELSSACLEFGDDRETTSDVDVATMIGAQRDRFAAIVGTCWRRDASANDFGRVLSRFNIPLIGFETGYRCFVLN
jgi:hypothetical protein